MAASLDTWTVRPHGALAHLSPAVATVTGKLRMPLTWLDRRMTLARLADGRLVVFGAIALDEAGMREVEAFGAPSFLVVPNAFHRLDAPAWKARYPDLVVVAPPGARAKVADVVAVDTTEPDFGDDAVRFVPVDGTGGREGALEVRDASGLTVVLNDVVGNLPREDGLVLRALGFAGDAPRIPRMAKRMLVADPRALGRRLGRWAEEPVTRLLVAHGRPVDRDVPATFDQLARSLG